MHSKIKSTISVTVTLSLLLTFSIFSFGQVAQAQDLQNTQEPTKEFMKDPRLREIKTEEIRSQIQQPTDGFTIDPANPNTINPRKFIFEIAPGTSIEDYVIIRNLSDKQKTFLLYGADPTFSAQGTPAYKTKMDATPEGEGSWITFETPEITLGPQENKILKFSVTAPKDAQYGDHRAGIAMEKNAKDTENPNITIATRVILHCDIKVTDNPQTIEKKFGEDIFASTPPTRPWQFWYFWISLILFAISLTALIVATICEKKCLDAKKKKSPRKKTSAKKKATTKKEQ